MQTESRSPRGCKRDIDILQYLKRSRDTTTPLPRWEAANVQSEETPDRYMAHDMSGNCRDDLANKSDIQFMIAREEKRLAFELSGRTLDVGRSEYLLKHFLSTRAQFVEGSKSLNSCESVACLYTLIKRFLA
jgi:hypothetical protein